MSQNWTRQDLAIYNLKQTPPSVRQASVDAKSEKELQREIVQWLRCKGVRAIVCARMDRKTTSRCGQADICCCISGRGLALEVKVGANQPSDEQRAWLADAAADGWTVAVVRSLPEAIEAYQQAAAKCRCRSSETDL